MRKSVFIASLLLITTAAHAGVIIEGTRLIYQGDKKEASLGVSNPDTLDYLVQSWVESVDNAREKTPFLITPPLFRLDGRRDNVLRVVRTGGNLPADRESLYWLNIKTIPSTSREESSNTLQIAIKTRIKLIYRPTGIKGKPDEVASTLRWHKQGNNLVVSNPTPFYMNFQAITLNGKKVDNVTWVAPYSEAHFAVPGGIGGTRVSWKIINDYGAVSHAWSASLQ
ncbi:molecular chaperone [Leclercia adecarboxylata]|uniref:fimbrial biogenesis chaperone n=1 Tax=Leclercia adecarboxylata TaxID=83655 RepID=UPI002DB9A300|nr:molecular chaperone [Leclercia adecarboxylata]MEB6379245.1 molecular chaperone [Leclercia adecarboxylata]